MLKEIEKLKKEKNIAIVAHHYASADIQKISDYLSDSYGFFKDIQSIKKRDDIDIIMIIAPTFFAELADTLTNLRFEKLIEERGKQLAEEIIEMMK